MVFKNVNFGPQGLRPHRDIRAFVCISLKLYIIMLHSKYCKISIVKQGTLDYSCLPVVLLTSESKNKVLCYIEPTDYVSCIRQI